MLCPGKFITIHGIDGTGKTTTAREVTRILQTKDIPVHNFEDVKTEIHDPFKEVKMRTPEGTLEELFATLGSKAIQANFIQAQLKKGTWIVKDRWIVDVLADRLHQGVVVPEVTGILEPDLAVILHCHEGTRMDRVTERADATEHDLIQNIAGTRARFFEEYLFDQTVQHAGSVVSIDSSLYGPQQVANMIISHIAPDIDQQRFI